jgi:hypothetical protein
VANVPWWAAAALLLWLGALVGSVFGGWLLVVACIAQVWVQGRRAGRYGPVCALVYPLLVVVFVVVALRALALTAAGHQVLMRGHRLARRSRV